MNKNNMLYKAINYISGGKLENKVTLETSLKDNKDAKKIFKNLKKEIKNNSNSYNNAVVGNLGTLVTKSDGKATYLGIQGYSNSIIAVGKQYNYIEKPNLIDFVEEESNVYKIALVNNAEVKTKNDGIHQQGQYDVFLFKIDMNEGKISYLNREKDSYNGDRPAFKIKGNDIVKIQSDEILKQYTTSKKKRNPNSCAAA